MAPRPTIEKSLILPALKFAFIGDAAAGNFTVTGIRQADKLLAVVAATLVLTEGAPNTLAWTGNQNLTSEFSITAANTINNTGGTTLVDKLALVVYLDVPEAFDPI